MSAVKFDQLIVNDAISRSITSKPLCTFAKNYQIWWRFDEILTKTSWAIFGHTLYM